MSKLHRHIFLTIILTIGYALPVGADSEATTEILAKAKDLTYRSEYQQTALLLQKILQQDPDNTEALTLLEEAFVIKLERQQNEDKLRQYLEAANYLAAKAQFTKVERQDPYNRNLIAYSQQLKALEEAELQSDDRLNLDQENEQKRKVLLAKAEKAMENSEYEKAIGYYQEALQLAPGDIVARDGIARAQRAIDANKQQQELEQYVADGIKLFNEKKYISAQRFFNRALSINANHEQSQEYLEKINELLKEKRQQENIAQQAETFYQDGNNFFAKREYDQAIDSYEKALLIVANYKDSSDKIRQSKGLQEQERLRVEREKADEIASLVQSGLVAYYAEDYTTAIAKLGKAVEYDPNNAQARDALERARDAQRLKSEEEVDDNSPFYPVVQTYRRKAEVLYNQGKYQQSKQQWNEILLLFPKNSLALQGSLKCDRQINPVLFNSAANQIIEEGKRYLENKNFVQAKRKFEMIREIDPNFPGLPNLLAKTEQRKQADQRPRLPRATLDAYYKQAVALYSQGKLPESMELLQKIVDNDPRNFQAIATLSKVRKLLSIEKGTVVAKPRGGLTEQQQRQAKQLYVQGLTHYSNNNYQAALEAWKKVLAIDPGHSEARANIVRVEKLLKS